MSAPASPAKDAPAGEQSAAKSTAEGSKSGPNAGESGAAATSNGDKATSGATATGTNRDGASASSNAQQQAGQTSGAQGATTGGDGGGAKDKPPSALDNMSPADLRKKLDVTRQELRAYLDRKKKVDQELAALEASIYAFEGSYLADQLFPATAQSASSAQFGNIIKGYDSYLKAASGGSDRKRGRGMDEPRQSDRMFSMSSATYQKAVDVRQVEAGGDSASEDETSSSTGRRKRR